MVVTSINFIIYINKKNEITIQIQFNQYVNQRNTFLVSTLLDLKQLNLIVNQNQSANVSQILGDKSRFEFYSEELMVDQEKLQDYHQKFKIID